MNLPTIPRWVPFAACMLLGLLLGWWLWHPRDATIESHADAIELPSGGHVIQRVPDAPIPEAVPQAVKQVKGAKLTRSISFDIKPKPLTATLKDCPPLHVDLGVVRMPDDTQRVITTSPDGQITNAVDIPVEPIHLQRNLKWSAGIVYDVLNSKYGAYLDRDVGPFRFGAEVIRTPDVRSYTAAVKVGIRF